MGSLPPPSVFRGRGHIISRTLTLGSSPIQTNFREVFHPYSISYHLGEVWVEFMTNTGPRISQEATPYGDSNQRWGRQRACGNGDHLLLSQPEQNGDM